jgi:membrane-bound ClpP family serine protease
MEKKEKKYLIMAILINVGIAGGAALFIVGAATYTKWLTLAAFAVIGIIGILCPILTAIIKFDAASETDKENVKKQLADAKRDLTNMDTKEFMLVVFIAIVVVSLMILMIMFSIMEKHTPMFICGGLFVGFGLTMAIITTIRRRSIENKIIKHPLSKTTTAIVILKQPYGTKKGIERFRYRVLIDGDEFYGFSTKNLEQGVEAKVMYNKLIKRYCVIL